MIAMSFAPIGDQPEITPTQPRLGHHRHPFEGINRHLVELRRKHHRIDQGILPQMTRHRRKGGT